MESKKYNERKKRVSQMILVLSKLFPEAKMALKYSNNWELLVAVILSAQCTDKRVNEVTKELFKKYRKLEDYVNVDLSEFEQDIKSTGFFRNKAKNILTAARVVKEEFDGKLPKTMEAMLTIPGVARKTANVVLGNAYNIVEGIAVDTHVRRFVIRFDLSDYRDPVRIEKDLMEIIPKKYWFLITYYLIDYGRAVCPAREHDCVLHPLTKIYPKASQLWPRAK